MKLATLKSESEDGRLVVVSRDLGHAVDASSVAANLHEAVRDWERCAPRLQALYEQLNAGSPSNAFA